MQIHGGTTWNQQRKMRMASTKKKNKNKDIVFSFGQWFKWARLQGGMNQAELSLKTNHVVSDATVSRIEQGTKKFVIKDYDITIIRAIGKTFDMPPELIGLMIAVDKIKMKVNYKTMEPRHSLKGIDQNKV